MEFTTDRVMSNLGNCSDPEIVPGPPFISRAHVSIAAFQIINDRLHVLSMVSCCFFLIL